MTTTNPALPLGYSPVAPGRVATVVTCLEMTAPPARAAHPPPPGLSLAPLDRRDLAGYRALYRAIGEDWLWFSRLILSDAELAAILGDEAVDGLVLVRDGRPAGLLELDFRRGGECELAFFGLVKEVIGQGAGRYLMDEALRRAWARPIGRFWVHTCTFDHPGALGFYVRSGFRPYAVEVEVAADPRLAGFLPRSAAPHVPVIEG